VNARRNSHIPIKSEAESFSFGEFGVDELKRETLIAGVQRLGCAKLFEMGLTEIDTKTRMFRHLPNEFITHNGMI
jgi:hypothetical protein